MVLGRLPKCSPKKTSTETCLQYPFLVKDTKILKQSSQTEDPGKPLADLDNLCSFVAENMLRDESNHVPMPIKGVTILLCRTVLDIRTGLDRGVWGGDRNQWT